jgi:hypothetical protein
MAANNRLQSIPAEILPLLLGILIATAVGCRRQAAPRVPAHGYVTGAGGAQIFYEVVGVGDDTSLRFMVGQAQATAGQEP